MCLLRCGNFSLSRYMNLMGFFVVLETGINQFVGSKAGGERNNTQPIDCFCTLLSTIAVYFDNYLWYLSRPFLPFASRTGRKTHNFHLFPYPKPERYLLLSDELEHSWKKNISFWTIKDAICSPPFFSCLANVFWWFFNVVRCLNIDSLVFHCIRRLPNDFCPSSKFMTVYCRIW